MRSLEKERKNMTNTLKKTVLGALGALMITSLCGCSSESTVEVTVDTKAEVKKLVDEFYAGVADANPMEMTTVADGTQSGIFTRDGTKLKYEDNVNNMVMYMFEENGKKYFLTEDMDQPTEEEYTYNMYNSTPEMVLTMTVLGYFQDDQQEEGLTYSATKKEVTENGKTQAELKVTITAEQDGTKAELTSLGTKTDDKVNHITFSINQGEQSMSQELDFKYDGISITLPEYEIVDISEYYEHVDSPFKTFEEAKKAAGKETLAYTIYDNLVVAVVNHEGKLYQLSAEMDEATTEAYNGLDFEADDYSEQVDKLLDPLVITDCVDFTALSLDQKTLDGYVGKKIGELVDEGFGHNGYGITEESSVIYLDRNDIVYEFEVTLPEGFDTEKDFEFEDLYDCVVTKGSYFDTNTSLLPLK
jgi:hypothetical protein